MNHMEPVNTNRKTTFICTVFCVAVILSCDNNNVIIEENPIKGVWSVESIKWIYPDTTYHLSNPQPGFLQFSDERYSFIWTPSERPRTPFNRLSEPSPEEMQAGFRSIVLNAGTYAKNDNQISIIAEIAKVPGFESGVQVFDYELKQDTLRYVMVDETYPSGEKPEWFGKMKTEFILVKIDD